MCVLEMTKLHILLTMYIANELNKYLMRSVVCKLVNSNPQVKCYPFKIWVWLEIS